MVVALISPFPEPWKISLGKAEKKRTQNGVENDFLNIMASKLSYSIRSYMGKH